MWKNITKCIYAQHWKMEESKIVKSTSGRRPCHIITERLTFAPFGIWLAFGLQERNDYSSVKRERERHNKNNELVQAKEKKKKKRRRKEALSFSLSLQILQWSFVYYGYAQRVLREIGVWNQRKSKDPKEPWAEELTGTWERERERERERRLYLSLHLDLWD